MDRSRGRGRQIINRHTREAAKLCKPIDTIEMLILLATNFWHRQILLWTTMTSIKTNTEYI